MHKAAWLLPYLKLIAWCMVQTTNVTCLFYREFFLINLPLCPSLISCQRART